MDNKRRHKKLPIGVKPLYTASLFPYSLNWDEEILPFATDSVADEINAITGLFPRLFTEEDKETLEDICRILRNHNEKSYRPEIREGCHRLTILSKSPIFVALDPDIGRGNEADKSVYSLERFVRLLILQHVLGHIKLDAKLINEATQFARNFRYRGRVEDDELIGWNSQFYKNHHEMFIPLLKANNWEELNIRVNEHDKNLNNPHPFKKAFEYLARLTAVAVDTNIASKQKRRRNNKLRNQLAEPKPNTNSPFSAGHHIQGDDKQAPCSILLNPFLDQNDEQGEESKSLDSLNETSIKSLAVRGAFLRLSSLVGGCSAEALYPAEAHACMQWLLSYKPKTPAEHLARLFWVLCGCTMQRFDNLVAAAGVTITNIPRPIIKLKVIGDRIEVCFNVLNSSSFEQVNTEASTLFSKVKSEVTYYIDLPPLSEALVLLKSLKGKKESDKLVQEILTSKREIQSSIRKKICSKFTENKFRGGFLQELFRITEDLPICQILSHDELGISNAALNYLAIDRNTLQTHISKTINSLYPTLPQKIETSISPIIIGAPTSAINPNVIRQSVRKLQQSIQWPFNSKQASLDNLIKEHEKVTEHVAWLLMLATANRNLIDFSEITLDQFSFGSKLIIFEDKGTDPSIFRRVVAITDFVIGEIFRLYHLTKILADRFRRRLSIPDYEEAHQHLKLQLKGDSPFFCKIVANNDHCSISKWNGRIFIRELIHEKINADLARHFFSTHMRHKQLLSPILIEAQLGHSCGYDFFSDSSSVSPIEFSEALQLPLNEYLSDSGYDTREIYSLPTGMNYESNNENWQNLYNEVSKTKKDDVDRIQSMITKSLSEIELDIEYENTSIKSLCNQVIRKHLKINSDKRLPKNKTLTENDTKKIYSNLIGAIKTANPIGLTHAASTLRKTIKKIASENNWEIKLPSALFWNINEPITLTKYHLKAYEALLELRKDIAHQLTLNSNEYKKDGLFALTILAFGGPIKISTIYQLIKNHTNITSSPKNDAIFIDIFEPVHQSLALSALTMTAFLSWKYIGVSNLTEKQLNKAIYESLPKKWTLENIELTLRGLESIIKLGRSIELPHLLFRTETQEIPSRNLTSERLTDLLANKKSSKNYEIETNIPAIKIYRTLTEKEKSKTKKNIGAKEEFKLLIESIEQPEIFNVKSTTNSKQPRTPNERAKIAIYRYCQKYRPNECIQLIAAWARILLGPAANLRSGGELAKSTINGYLRSLNTIIVKCISNISIFDFEEEELKNIIESELNEHTSGHDDYVYALNRFFFEMSEPLNLPELVFRYNDDNSSALETIRAAIFTPAEVTFSSEILDHWSQDPLISSLTSLSLKNSIDYLSATEILGTRRSELLYSKNTNINFFGETVIIDIRANRERSLKTSASKRSILIPNSKLNLNKNKLNTKDNSYIFSNFNRLNNPTKILHQALKHSTGDHSSRGHDLRHTKASSKIIEIFSILNIIDRIKLMSKTHTELGHASPTTTVSCYGHTNSYTTSINYSVSVKSLKEKELLALSIGILKNIRQKFNYSRKNRISENIQILKSFSQTNITLLNFKKTISLSPENLHAKDTTLSDALISLMNVCNKKNVIDIYKPSIRQIDQHKLIGCFAQAQIEIGIDYISNERLINIKNNSINLDQCENRSQISREKVEIWSKEINKIDSKNKFISAYLAIESDAEILINRRGTDITITTTSIESCNTLYDALLQLNSPMEVDYLTKTKLQISLIDTQQQIRRASIKFFILAIYSIGLYCS